MAQNNNNKIAEKLKKLSEAGKTADAQKKTQEEMLAQMTGQKDDKPDFKQIAEELAKRHEEEKRSLNSGYVKDTIYIQEDIYKAFNALCTERGLKKQYVNEALADFVSKKYRELQSGKN